MLEYSLLLLLVGMLIPYKFSYSTLVFLKLLITICWCTVKIHLCGVMHFKGKDSALTTKQNAAIWLAMQGYNLDPLVLSPLRLID